MVEDPSAIDLRTERDAISMRALAIAAIVLALAIAAVVVAAHALLRAYTPATGAGTAPQPGPVPTIVDAPRLQSDPAQEIAAYRAEKRAQLETYGWVDRAHGIVHIPIERAMALVAGDGREASP